MNENGVGGGGVAELIINDNRVRLRLTVVEKIGGLMRDREFPLGAVREVRVETDPLRGVRGLRSPGLAVPRRVKIGTWRRRGHRSIVVVRGGVPAVCLTLAGERVSEVVVSTPDAAEVSAAIASRLP